MLSEKSEVSFEKPLAPEFAFDLVSWDSQINELMVFGLKHVHVSQYIFLHVDIVIRTNCIMTIRQVVLMISYHTITILMLVIDVMIS